MFSTEEREELRRFYTARGEVFLGPIEDNHANEVIMDLIQAAEGCERVQMVIASPGGNTDEGFRLAQFIEQELTVPVDARVWGQCSSAATYTLLCCQNRIAHPESTFVLHRQTCGIKLEYDLGFKKSVREWMKDNRKTHERQVRFYTRKLNLSKDEVEEVLLRGTGDDNEITTKKALRIRLITGVTQFTS